MPKKHERYFCYTDGACKKSPGTPGGWGFHIKGVEAERIEGHGGAIKTDPMAMELTAIREALSALPDGANATVFSDSKSALDVCSRRLAIWKANGWKNVDPKHLELVQALEALIATKGLRLEWTWLRSHNGNAGNERADDLAAEGAREAERQYLLSIRMIQP